MRLPINRVTWSVDLSSQTLDPMPRTAVDSFLRHYWILGYMSKSIHKITHLIQGRALQKHTWEVSVWKPPIQ